MFVTKRGSSGKEYVYLQETVREKNGKTKTRLIKNFGRLDRLIKETGDPNIYETLKNKYREEKLNTIKQQQNEALNWSENFLSAVARTKREADILQRFPLLSYGYAPLRQIWNGELDMDKKLWNLQDFHGSRKEVPFHKIISFLVFSKVLNPSSIRRTLAGRPSWLGNMLDGVSLEDCYESLSFLKEHKESIFRFLNKKIDAVRGKERASLVFYDVTNAYFESPLTDAERGLEQDDYEDQSADYVREEIKRGEAPADCFSPCGELIHERIPSALQAEMHALGFRYLKMRGPSKEHRADLPLVSIALAIDKDGIPMDFEVYSGNASEFRTMKEAIAKLQKKYVFDRCIVTADRGLNSTDNLKMLLDGGLGFLVAQKVSQLKKEYTDRILDWNRYTPIDPSNPSGGKYLVIPNFVKNSSNGQESVKCTLVVTFSESRKRRDDALIDAQVEMVRRHTGQKVSSGRHGWRKLAKESVDKTSVICGVDEAAVKRMKRFSGLAGMVYCEPPEAGSEKAESDTGHRQSLDGAFIASQYHRLTQIEDCFRIMKTNLRLRPMFVWTSDHVRGHITVCVLALMLIQLLRAKLDENGSHIPIPQLTQALRDAKFAALKNPDGRIYFANTQVYTEDLDSMYDGSDDFEDDLLSAVKSFDLKEDLLPKIMEVCGLQMPKGICSREEINRCLGLHIDSDAETMSEKLSEKIGLPQH